jgi:hypothetical protein
MDKLNREPRYCAGESCTIQINRHAIVASSLSAIDPTAKKRPIAAEPSRFIQPGDSSSAHKGRLESPGATFNLRPVGRPASPVPFAAMRVLEITHRAAEPWPNHKSLGIEIIEVALLPRGSINRHR